jgi:hypothetical protein
LFQEYDFESVVKPGKLNARPDHLSGITNGEEPKNLEDNFLMLIYFLFRLLTIILLTLLDFFSTRMAPKEFTVA